MTEPSFLHASDGEWSYYLRGHDPSLDVLGQVGEPEELEYERLWMRPINASQADDYGLSDDGSEDTVLRDQATGRFVARVIWVECPEGAPGAETWMGVRYRRAAA